MSEMLDGYKKKYRKLSDSLLKKSGSSTSLFDEEQKKQKITEIGTGLNEAEALIESMDREARESQPNVKEALNAKVREYKSDLKDLKSKVKKITIANLNPSIRDGLLETGKADTIMTLPSHTDSSNVGNVVAPPIQDQHQQLDSCNTALTNPRDSSNIQHLDVPPLPDQHHHLDVPPLPDQHHHIDVPPLPDQHHHLDVPPLPDQHHPIQDQHDLIQHHPIQDQHHPIQDQQFPIVIWDTALTYPSGPSNDDNLDVPLIQHPQIVVTHEPVHDNENRRKPVKCIIFTIVTVVVLVAIFAALYFKGFIKLPK